MRITKSRACNFGRKEKTKCYMRKIRKSVSHNEFINTVKDEIIIQNENIVQDDILQIESNAQQDEIIEQMDIKNGIAHQSSIHVEALPMEPKQFSGNVIVDMAFLWEQILSISNHNSLNNCSFSDIVLETEIKHGYFIKYVLLCKICGSKFDLLSSQEDADQGINFNAVLGTIISGIGYSQLKQISSSLNIGCIRESKYRDLHNKIENLVCKASEKSTYDGMKDEI